MVADPSPGNYLFPLSNHCRALDPVLRQIHSKHGDRCIHKNSSRGPGVCSDAALNRLSTEQLSRLPFVYPPCRRAGEVEQRKVVGARWDEMKLTRRSSGRKDNFGCDNGWADAKLSGKVFKNTFFEDRPSALCYFKYIVLKCGGEQANRQTNAHKCKKSLMVNVSVNQMECKRFSVAMSIISQSTTSALHIVFFPPSLRCRTILRYDFSVSAWNKLIRIYARCFAIMTKQPRPCLRGNTSGAISVSKCDAT